MPGECVTNALPVDDGMSTPWAPDLQHMLEALLGWLAEQVEERGEAAVEEEDKEEDKEEDQRRRSSMASGVAPRQAPMLV